MVATILPRRKEAIVVNLLYIRALLLRDEVLILDSAEGLDSGLHKVYMANLTVSTTSDGRVRGEELSDFEGLLSSGKDSRDQILAAMVEVGGEGVVAV